MNIRFTADPLPSDFKGSMQDFQSRFLLNLKGTVPDGNLLRGKIGGTKPNTNIGPWLNGSTWYVWNGSEYVPATLKVGGAGFIVQLGDYTSVGSSAIALPTYVQTLQDKDGTVALLDDIYKGRDAVVLTGTTPVIDWNLSNNFVETLSGNSTMGMDNSQDGQEIFVALRNNATSYSVTWQAVPVIFWSSGVAPTQTASKTDMYIFKNIGGSIFGRQIPNYS